MEEAAKEEAEEEREEDIEEVTEAAEGVEVVQEEEEETTEAEEEVEEEDLRMEPLDMLLRTPLRVEPQLETLKIFKLRKTLMKPNTITDMSQEKERTILMRDTQELGMERKTTEKEVPEREDGKTRRLMMLPQKKRKSSNHGKSRNKN